MWVLSYITYTYEDSNSCIKASFNFVILVLLMSMVLILYNMKMSRGNNSYIPNEFTLLVRLSPFLRKKKLTYLWCKHRFFFSTNRHFYQLLLSAKQEMQNRSTKRRSVAKKAIKKMKHMLGLSSADKASTFHQNEVVHKLTIEVENFDVMVFERFMCYVHCGTVAVNISNVVGKCTVCTYV